MTTRATTEASVVYQVTFIIDIMGFPFCCLCGSDEDLNEKSQREAEVRRTRIQNVYDASREVMPDTITAPPTDVLHVLQAPPTAYFAPPPTYTEAVPNGQPGYPVDDKEAYEYDQRHPRDPNRTPLAHSRSSSPQTSIISVPSTRLTDLTVSYTGHTHQTDTTGPTFPPPVLSDRDGEMSSRSSLSFESPPPSYWSPSSRTPDRRESAEDMRQHPVLTTGWLQRLQQQAHLQAQHPMNPMFFNG